MIAPQREQFLQRLALFSDLEDSELRELADVAQVVQFPASALIFREGETDPAWVFLKREKGIWRGLTIGTFFTPEDYAEFHIPPSIQL